MNASKSGRRTSSCDAEATGPYSKRMKLLFKWAIRLFVAVVVVVVVFILSLDTAVKALTEYRLQSQTGLEAKIGRMEIGLLNPKLTIEGLKLYNAPEFGGAPFIDLPELHLEYDRAALAERKLHFTLVRLNLAEVNVVVNKAGQTNTAAVQGRLEKQKAGQSRHRKKIANLEFAGIDSLNLTLGTARFTDLRDPGHNIAYTLGLTNQILTNVTAPQDLYGLVFLLWAKNGMPSLGEILKPTQ